MTDQSIRGFLKALDECHDLVRIHEPVDPVHELAAYLFHLDKQSAVIFEQVKGQTLRVVGNLLNSRARIGFGLGCTPAQLPEKLISAIAHPRAVQPVADGPCQEVVVTNPDLAQLPIPYFFEHETGPYITAGAIVARDRHDGYGNLSIARLKPLGGNRAFVGIAPNHHLAVMARAAQSRGEKLEIAVTIGNHPAVMMASALYLGLGDDELEVAGALLGEPVRVVGCKAVDLQVPADCEIVLEGTLDPDTLVEEGPVSEFHGLYEHYGRGYVVTFHHLTRREDAIYQCILPGYAAEHVLIGAVSIAAGLGAHLGSRLASFHNVAVTCGGAGRLHAVVSLKESCAVEAKKAIFAVWDAVHLIKQVTVVDDDIDPWDAVQVEWAVATRMRAERDLTVVEAMPTNRSEPLQQDGVIAKIGIDATKNVTDRSDWTSARPPEAVLARVREKLDGGNVMKN